MATFDEIMAAAVNADKAGDTQAAQMLVDLARQSQGQAAPVTGSANPPENDPMVPFAEAPGTPQTPSPKQQDRFGDTIKSATAAPYAATKAYGAGLLDQENSISLQNMPEWVPDALKRPAATIADTAMTGLNLAGTAYALGAGTVGEVFGGSPTQEKKLARDLMMMGEVAVPELAGSSSIVRAAGAGARASENLSRPATATQKTARAADDLGITPSLGAGGKVRSMTSAALEKVPFAGSVIAKDATRFVGEVERAFDGLSAQVGKAQGANAAGEALQAGANKFVAEFKDRSGRLFNDVGAKIPADTLVQSPDTLKAIREAFAPFADKPELARRLGLDKWANIATDLEGGLSWEAASALRSSIGKSVGKLNGPMADMDGGRLKQVYGTLTADLEKAAIAAGPEAEKAWRRANNYYRRGAERIESALDKTIKADSPERAFEAFEAMTKEGRSSANANRLYKIKNAMPAQEWDTVAASIVDRLGQVSAGQKGADGGGFSPAAFLTNWNKMSPEAKSILFPPEVRKEMNKLAEVAEGSKRANAERNFSNTGQINAALLVAGGGAVDLGLTATALTGSYLGAKALTNPRMLRALNAAGRGDLRQLKAIERSSSPFAKDAATILRINAAGAAQGSANTSNPPLRAVR